MVCADVDRNKTGACMTNETVNAGGRAFGAKINRIASGVGAICRRRTGCILFEREQISLQGDLLKWLRRVSSNLALWWEA